MKRRVLSLFALLAMLMTLCAPALAAAFEEAELDFVTDAAGILTEEALSELEQRAAEISQRYQCGVYVVVLDDFTSYVSDADAYEAAKAIYQEYKLGFGEERSGELLLLSMAERDYALIAFGYGNTAFTDYGKNVLSDAFLDDFGDDDWYGGFSDYLEESEAMLAAAQSGEPLDVDSGGSVSGAAAFGCSLLPGFALALLITFCVKRVQMHSVAGKTEANAYVLPGSVEITGRQDFFTHTTEVRRKIEQSDSGSGTTIDSDGFSGGSGKF